MSPKAALLVTLEAPTGALTSSQRPNAVFALTIRQGDVLVAQARMSLLARMPLHGEASALGDVD